jgi:hypothetical protein
MIVKTNTYFFTPASEDIYAKFFIESNKEK